MRNRDTIRIVMSAMFVALVMGATYIGIPTPGGMGGYWHLGTLVMVVIALKYGWKMGMISGGIGMMLFDIFSAWFLWAPATLVIRLLMGAAVGFIAQDSEKGQGGNVVKNVLALAVGAAIMMVGYYIFQAFMLSTENYGGTTAAIAGIPGNAMQNVVAVIALFMVPFLPSIPEVTGKTVIE